MGDSGEMKNIGQMMKQAQKLQAQDGRDAGAAGNTEISGAAGGGMVQVTVTGKGEVRKAASTRRWSIPNDVEVLEDLLVAAFNDAKAKVEAARLRAHG